MQYLLLSITSHCHSLPDYNNVIFILSNPVLFFFSCGITVLDKVRKTKWNSERDWKVKMVFEQVKLNGPVGLQDSAAGLFW